MSRQQLLEVKKRPPNGAWAACQSLAANLLRTKPVILYIWLVLVSYNNHFLVTVGRITSEEQKIKKSTSPWNQGGTKFPKRRSSSVSILPQDPTPLMTSYTDKLDIVATMWDESLNWEAHSIMVEVATSLEDDTPYHQSFHDAGPHRPHQCIED